MRQIKTYYIYDWDDNILFMPTKITLDKMVDGVWIKTTVSTAKFRDVKHHIDSWSVGEFGDNNTNYRWRYCNGDVKQSISEFRDWGIRGNNAFYLDVKKAIHRKKFGPSFDNFIETLINGRIFLICTARGHEPENIRAGIEYIIFNYLTPEQQRIMMYNLKNKLNKKTTDLKKLTRCYLNICEFIGTDSNYFKDHIQKSNNSLDTSNSKIQTIRYFLDKLNVQYDINGAKVGFSDDTIDTLNHVEKYMKNELSLVYDTDFYVIDTSNPTLVGGIKKKI